MTMPKLNQEELAVLELVRERLELGQARYGGLDLSNDSRDLVKEALEEALDLAVYLSCRLLQIQSAQKKDAVITPEPADFPKECSILYHCCGGKKS